MLTAEGGTFTTHAATVARAKHLTGHYELMPNNPLISSNQLFGKTAGHALPAAACVEFNPENFQQLAGLVAFYNTDSFYYLHLTWAPHSIRCLGLMKCEKGIVTYPLENNNHWIIILPSV